MKILFISTKSPLPINDGHSTRTYNILKIASKNHEIDLLTFVKFKEEYDYFNELKKICCYVKLIALPENDYLIFNLFSLFMNIFEKIPFVFRKYNSLIMRKEIIRLLKKNKYDFIHLDMLPLGVYINDINYYTILNEHNVESDLLKKRLQKEINILKKLYLIIQQKRLETHEINVLKKVNHVISCSKVDQTIINKLSNSNKTTVVANGVDTLFFKPNKKIGYDLNKIVFLGGMNWFPNRDAIIWFDKYVMTKLIKFNSNYNLTIIGKNNSKTTFINNDKIIFTGYVEDVRPYLDEASIFVVPIRMGGGTRLKVLEAMSMEKVVITTEIGFEGIEAQNNKHLIVANSKKEFYKSIIKISKNESLFEEIGKSARKFVIENYEWNVIGKELTKVYNTIK